jgi:hypothetical protein
MKLKTNRKAVNRLLNLKLDASVPVETVKKRRNPKDYETSAMGSKYFSSQEEKSNDRS